MLATKLKEAFGSAETTDEMLNLLKEIEIKKAFNDLELGIASFRIAFNLHHVDEDHEKALSFANRALQALDFEGFPPFHIATLFHLLGSIHLTMKRFSDSLSYFNRANQMLSSVMDEPIVSPLLQSVLLFLAKAHKMLFNFKEALMFCFKALEIHEKLRGHDSVVVGHDRRNLGIIYSELEEHEKALEHNALARRIYKDLDRKSDLLDAEIDASNVMIELRRYDEAIGTLKNVVQQTKEMDEESETRAFALIAIAKAFCNQENFVDCKSYLETSLGILEKREDISPVDVSDAYSKIWVQYETMHEFETAISLLKKTLVLLEKLPYEQHSMGKVSAKLGKLLLQTGEVEEAVTYLERAAESLKYSFGPKHIQVGYNYANLGAAYAKLGKPQSAAQMFAVAKDIMDVSLASDDVDTIEACQNLAKAYGEMKSFGLAIDFQQQVIGAWESHGASGEDKLKEAHQLLEELKGKASGFYANESLGKNLS